MIGDITSGEFVPWKLSNHDAIEKFVGYFTRGEIGGAAWLCNTPLGDEVAKAAPPTDNRYVL